MREPGSVSRKYWDVRRSPLARKAMTLMAAVTITGGLAVAGTAAAPAARAAAPDACTTATVHSIAVGMKMVVACSPPGLPTLGAKACLQAIDDYIVALEKGFIACSGTNSQSLGSNVNEDPGQVVGDLQAVGDTDPQPGDVLIGDITSTTTDSSGDITWSIDLTGWENGSTWGGGGSEPPPDLCNFSPDCGVNA